MSLRSAGGLLAFSLVAAPLSAQHAFTINMHGGGYEHLVDLNDPGAASASFKPGYNLGFGVGLEVTRSFGVYTDLTFADARARGASSFSGSDVEEGFYGGHVEFRFPQPTGWTAYVLLGAGAVSVSQASGTVSPSFTRPAGAFGVGAGYTLPTIPVEVFVEGKTLIYKWVGFGYDRMQVDVTVSVGFSYRIAWM